MKFASLVLTRLQSLPRHNSADRLHSPISNYLFHLRVSPKMTGNSSNIFTRAASVFEREGGFTFPFSGNTSHASTPATLAIIFNPIVRYTLALIRILR